MQETRTIGPIRSGPWDILSNQSLVTLLALVGSRRLDVRALQERTKLAPVAFGNLLGWLQREYLVEVVSGLDGDEVAENVHLTDRGETVLVGMLEKTCELPELH
ncbi:MAG TPA: hypothetical protein VGR53_04150 [Nitrososphaerales archaeon]|nr:hypothetical protein [Nitrososphaerales archaeon]